MAHLLVSAAILLLAAPSWGQGSTLVIQHVGEQPALCPVPVSICNAGDGSGCPAGTACRCIPSCPSCTDCAFGVCMADSRPVPVEPRICEERRAGAEQAIEQLLARSTHCRQHRDCVWLDTSIDCSPSCGSFVNRRLARRLARDLRRIDERHCVRFLGLRCFDPAPTCQPQQGFCLRNRCVAMPLGR